MILFPVSLGVIAILIPLTTSQATNYNKGGVGCVDPSGYSSCYDSSADDIASCYANCGNKYPADSQLALSCRVDCESFNLAENFVCWLESCWNMVYSCEYQETAVNYISRNGLPLDTDTIPYYPAPDNAPGACSCNLGEVYGNMTGDVGLSCYAHYPADLKSTWNCECCQASQLYSNIFNICPSYDLSILDFPDWFSNSQSALQDEQPAVTTDNCSIIDSSPSTCVSKYGFQIQGSKWWNPFSISDDDLGTVALSDVAGSMTAPPWGTTATTAFLPPSFTITATPSPFNTKNAATTSATAAGKSGSGSATIGSTASSTSTAAAKSDGTTTFVGDWKLHSVVMLMVVLSYPQ